MSTWRVVCNSSVYIVTVAFSAFRVTITTPKFVRKLKREVASCDVLAICFFSFACFAMVLSRLFFGTHHPEIYHGDGLQQHFEGWYFKIVDVQQSVCWAIIPGIYKCIQMPELCQAFIMTLDGRTHKSTFHSFPVDDF